LSFQFPCFRTGPVPCSDGNEMTRHGQRTYCPQVQVCSKLSKVYGFKPQGIEIRQTPKGNPVPKL
jgi:hypothetical protein